MAQLVHINNSNQVTKHPHSNNNNNINLTSLNTSHINLRTIRCQLDQQLKILHIRLEELVTIKAKIKTIIKTKIKTTINQTPNHMFMRVSSKTTTTTVLLQSKRRSKLLRR